MFNIDNFTKEEIKVIQEGLLDLVSTFTAELALTHWRIDKDKNTLYISKTEGVIEALTLMGSKFSTDDDPEFGLTGRIVMLKKDYEELMRNAHLVPSPEDK